jgi:hypothetical protein
VTGQPMADWLPLSRESDSAALSRSETRSLDHPRVGRRSSNAAKRRSASSHSGEPSAGAGPLPWLTVGYAEVRLLNGHAFTVEGTSDEVESKLSDAARSGQSRLAWFTQYGTDGSLGVNPAHVATLKVSEISD